MELFTELERIILLSEIDQKCQATQNLVTLYLSKNTIDTDHQAPIISIATPGRPANLDFVAPRQLKRRGMQTQEGRNVLMHAIAHIEFNAINLALDAAYRFRNQPQDYYQDWLSVAADDTRHFNLIRDYLQSNNSDYSDYPVHNGLWDMAVQTANDVVARMALVPRVLEARGLDVTPHIIKKLQNVGDDKAVDILTTIYQDEIGHVKIGSYWFNYQCKQQSIEPKETFVEMVKTHLHGDLKGPFNIAARLQAGFDEAELESLNRVES